MGILSVMRQNAKERKFQEMPIKDLLEKLKTEKLEDNILNIVQNRLKIEERQLLHQHPQCKHLHYMYDSYSLVYCFYIFIIFQSVC